MLHGFITSTSFTHIAYTTITYIRRTYTTNISKLQVLQDKSARIVPDSSRRNNIANTYRCTKYITKRYLPIFHDLFMHNCQINGHCTRVSSHFNVSLTSRNHSKTEMRYQRLIVLNDIFTININPDWSDISFTVMLKIYQPEFKSIKPISIMPFH